MMIHTTHEMRHRHEAESDTLSDTYSMTPADIWSVFNVFKTDKLNTNVTSASERESGLEQNTKLFKNKESFIFCLVKSTRTTTNNHVPDQIQKVYVFQQKFGTR